MENAKSEKMTAKEKDILKGLEKYRYKFIEAMDDDLNTADAIAAIFELVKEINTKIDGESSKELIEKSYELFRELTEVLGLLTKKKEILDEDIQRLIEERQKARKEKNYALADKIRDDLKAKGIILEDTPQGVKWKRV
jgi:cysteinyl-tRNA synthetase